MPAPTSTPTEVTPPVATPVEPKAGDVDDLGYTIPAEPESTEVIPSDDNKPAEKPTETKDDTGYKEGEKGEDSTGYGEEDDTKKPEEKPAEKTAEELTKEKKDEENKTDEEKATELVEANIKKHIEGLPENFDKERIANFAKENGMTDKQIEAYVKLETENHASLVAERATAVKEQRKAWKGELQGDPEFGGENFDKNVDRVNKVLDKYMPDTKKVLTERGTMLPPYIMRDFLKLDKVLNPTSKLPTGEPPAVKKEEVSLLDELYS